jgi:hypothetical protein
MACLAASERGRRVIELVVFPCQEEVGRVRRPREHVGAEIAPMKHVYLGAPVRDTKQYETPELEKWPRKDKNKTDVERQAAAFLVRGS